MIVVLCGPPGAGKSTVAARLEHRLSKNRTDVDVRRFSSDAFSSRTYEQLFERVRASCGERWAHDDAPAADASIAIVDGTFYRREWRERFRTLGDVYFVRLEAALETCLERNRRRPSDAAIDERGVHVVYREFEPVDADRRVDTDALSLEATADRVLEALAEWRER